MALRTRLTAHEAAGRGDSCDVGAPRLTPAARAKERPNRDDEPRRASFWKFSNRADKAALPLADRHYNRQKIGSPQFVPPGKCLVLLSVNEDAVWVSSWPIAKYVKHAWAGAWVNSLFRNEGPTLSSDLIKQAVRITYAMWGPPPPLGMVTFVDTTKVRRKRDPGRCYRKAGWIVAGMTKGGLVALQATPACIESSR